ncbi:MAG: hypothetical protein HQK83_08660 [Fibrobacteria bacterium]|nr:hypothetical protein [Fibrobacteria bacterium]
MPNRFEKGNLLIRQAYQQHRNIFPCMGKNKLEDCFTTSGNKVYFWFNTKDANTHMLSMDMSAA